MEQGSGKQTPRMCQEMKKHVKVTRTITVEVDNYTEIDDVKDKFCELEDVGTNLQNTFFTKRNIENGQVLDYERKDGSSVHMSLRLGVKMQILITVSWSAKFIPLDVHSWDTIHDVKTKFQEKEGIPANQLSLIYGKQLEDFQTLEAYRIYNGCVVFAVSLGEDKFEISIKMPEGETVQLEVKLCSSVQNVKTMFKCMMGFPIDHQNLIFNGTSLKNDRILADYKIQKYSVLYFTFLVPGVIDIAVKTLTGRIIIVYVTIDETISGLKKKITYKEGIPVDQQRLMLDDGRQLEDGRTMRDCKIQKGCTVRLVLNLCALQMEQGSGTQTPRMCQEMKKHVKVTRTITVEVDNYTEIDDVKDKFCELEDVGTNLQNTFFTKRNIENGQVLDYERKDGSSVHMSLRLGVKMQILITVSWSAKFIPLDVHSWDTIHDVKTKFQDKEGIPANQLSLIYGKQLEDFQTLEAYQIYNGCVVFAVSLGEDKFEISIKMPEGETVQLEVKLCSRVLSVKTMFRWMMGFPIDHQNLIFNGASLKNDRILADYKIQKYSQLYFTFLVPGVIDIAVETLTGKIIIVYVNIDETISDLKWKITYKEGIPVDQQCLMLDMKRLRDGRTIGDCQIQKGCTVLLLLSMCGC